MSSDNTVQLVSLALDAALMRQTAIANNIANSNSPGFQSMEVHFEDQLKDAEFIRQDEDLSRFKPFYQLSDKPSSIDEQMVLNVQNITHYRALIKGLNQKFSIMKCALQGNNQ